MKKHKFGIIDALAILLVVIFVAGLAIRISRSKNLVTEEAGKCEFTVRVDDLRKAGADSIIKGDTLSDGVEDVYGVIKDVKVEDYTCETTLDDGTKKVTKKPGRYTVYATVELDGTWKDNVFYLTDEQSLGKGSDFYVISKHTKCEGKVSSAVKKID